MRRASRITSRYILIIEQLKLLSQTTCLAVMGRKINAVCVGNHLPFFWSYWQDCFNACQHCFQFVNQEMRATACSGAASNPSTTSSNSTTATSNSRTTATASSLYYTCTTSSRMHRWPTTICTRTRSRGGALSFGALVLLPPAGRLLLTCSCDKKRGDRRRGVGSSSALEDMPQDGDLLS